jgi:hypothetical protein
LIKISIFWKIKSDINILVRIIIQELSMPLQIRRGPTADRIASTPLEGELVYDTDTGAVYIGNGDTAGGNPIAVFTPAEAKVEAVKLLLGPDPYSDNTIHTGITFQYNGTRIIATTQADLSQYQGLIQSDQGFKGNLWGNDSTLLVNAETGAMQGTLTGDVKGSVYAAGDGGGDSTGPLVDGTNASINLDGTIKGNVLPATTNTYNLGSSTYRFKDLYLSGSSIYLGGAVLREGLGVGEGGPGTLELPAGTTIGGNPVGINEGLSYNISITGSASGDVLSTDLGTTIIDSSLIKVNLDGTIRGNLIPYASETYSIGSFSNKFDKLYLKEGANLYVGNAVITSSGTTIDLPANSTIGGSAVGGSVSSGTANQLAFYSSTGTTVSGSGTELTFNSGSNTLTVGSTTVGGLIRGYSQTAGSQTMTLSSHHNDATNVNSVQFQRSRGTGASPTAVQTSDLLYDLRFVGYDGTANQAAAVIRSEVATTVTSGAVPGTLRVLTANRSGVLTLALTINASQNVFVPNGFFDINNTLRLFDNKITTVNTNTDIEFDPNGTGTVDLVVPEQSTVGAAGAASALPATPSTYFKIKVSGVEYVVPAYAVS